MQVQFRGDWQVQHCTDPNCRIGPLLVRRDPHWPHSWWVAGLDGGPVWREAASEPGCPWCGENLSASVSEAVSAAPAPSNHAA